MQHTKSSLTGKRKGVCEWHCRSVASINIPLAPLTTSEELQMRFKPLIRYAAHDHRKKSSTIALSYLLSDETSLSRKANRNAQTTCGWACTTLFDNFWRLVPNRYFDDLISKHCVDNVLTFTNRSERSPGLPEPSDVHVQARGTLSNYYLHEGTWSKTLMVSISQNLWICFSRFYWMPVVEIRLFADHMQLSLRVSDKRTLLIEKMPGFGVQVEAGFGVLSWNWSCCFKWKLALLFKWKK